MNARALLVAGAVAVLCGCNQGTSAGNETANAAANTAAAVPKHPSYCFFKDADTKGWAASRGKSGDVTVKGKAHLEDTRYTAQLSPPEMSGTTASLWLTMGPNTGAYGAPDNWWDVTATVSNGSALDTVKVMCGAKTVAELKLAPAKP
jgi:hypothetical protein